MNKKSIYSALTLLLFILSCKKEKPASQHTAANGQVSYYIKAVTAHGVKTKSANSVSSGDPYSTASAIQWETASIYINGISFEGINGTQASITKPVEKNFDLFASNPSIGQLDLPDGEFKDANVLLRLKKSMKSDLAFKLSGKFTDSKGHTVPFFIGNSDEFNVKLSVSTIRIDPSKSYNATITYQLDKVFEGISTEELESACKYYTIDGGLLVEDWDVPYSQNIEKGVAISSSVNIPLYEKVKANWQKLATAEFKEN